MSAEAPCAAAGTRPARVLAVVPARLASTRLPRKMLLRETGSYLFEHTVRAVRSCAGIDRVVLAADSDEVERAAAEVGIECVHTDPRLASGTDRVHAALQRLIDAGESWSIVVNVQGDEPEIAAEDLQRLIAAFTDGTVEAATLWAPIDNDDQAHDPAVVKVVVDGASDALYFSRSPIPSRAHARPGAPGIESLRRHIGVYAYRPAALAAFCSLPTGRLEAVENLEQLRWLEAGRRMRVVSAVRLPRGIDTREDYDAFVRRCGAPNSALERH